LSFWSLEVFDDLPSTSDLCVSRAKAGVPAGLAIIAKRQTAGRGSRGRAWQAPDGNLNLSVLLRPTTPAAEAGLFALRAGIAVAEALPIRPMLKWPNDVLLNGAKLAGLLIDAAPSGQALDWLVIGIGINLTIAPEIPSRAVTALASHGVKMEPIAAAHAVLASLSRWLLAAPADIIETWLSYGHPLGTALTINGTISGRFAGLTPAGELRLARENRIETFNTGDVLLGQMVGEGESDERKF